MLLRSHVLGVAGVPATCRRVAHARVSHAGPAEAEPRGVELRRVGHPLSPRSEPPEHEHQLLHEGRARRARARSHDAARHRRQHVLDDVLRELWQRFGAQGIGVPEDGFESLAVEIGGVGPARVLRRRGSRHRGSAAARVARGVRRHARAARGGRAGRPRRHRRAWRTATCSRSASAIASATRASRSPPCSTAGPRSAPV